MSVFLFPPSVHITSLLFFFNDTATTEISTLSLHDALPILRFDAHQQAGGGEEPAPDLEIPACVSPAAQHARAVRSQARFHGVEPLLLLLPLLAPDGRGDRPERRRPWRAAASPRR